MLYGLVFSSHSQVGRRRVMLAVFLAVSSAWSSAQAVEDAKVDFQREVLPILAENCTACHGVDEASRSAGLRLDVREAAVQGGESGIPALVPNQPDASELVRRITSSDLDLRMPPTGHDPVSAEHVAVLRRWIAQGAPYDEHWAFKAPVKQPLPIASNANPVDAFVQHELDRLGMQLSPTADPATLCRRVYLDLIGLPPSPQEFEQFQRVGLAATVDQLLSSERFGEKWARHWMDAARYSDTNGYEKDLQREQWMWRDWVVHAFNTDMPYDQFLVEQVAGDLLPNASAEQIIATGFLRNSMINEEGAIVPEQFRMVEMFDRVDCVGKAVLGISTQCAQCHSHKFDPISHEEYFGMFAFLNNSYEAKSWVYTAEQRTQIAKLRESIAGLENRIRSERANWQEEMRAYKDAVLAQQARWTPIEPHKMEAISGLNHPTLEADKSILMLGHTSNDIYYVASPEVTGATGLRLEVLTHGDLPFRGPGHGRPGTWSINELEVHVRRANAKEWEKVKLANASADFSEAEQKHDEGKRTTGPVALLIDGSDSTAWQADRGNGLRNQASVAVLQFAEPLSLEKGSELKVAMRMNDMVGCCRISLTTDADPKAMAVDHEAILAMQVPEAERTEAQRSAIFAAWRRSLGDYQAINTEIAGLYAQFPNAPTSILHMMEREPQKARLTQLLDRGNWDQPKQVIEPHVPVAFHPMPETAEPARLRFARWMADARSPLTARVAVNRVWQSIFGEGLVETSEDFGTRTPVPEYRELLDWLAVDFVENRWSHKNLIRTIVTSRVYQQDSKASVELKDRDPRNRLLARGPRFRADAEAIRDIALSAAGLMTHQLGGPSVIPPVPQNVLDYNYTYPSYWTPAQGPQRYRRSVYVFRKRSMPDPVMSVFDSPNGDFACARRVRSNTPLAALTSLNETIFVEAAQALAMRVLREGGPDDASRAKYAFQLCATRMPTDNELRVIQGLLESRRKRLADGWLNPREIVTGDPNKLPELPANTTPQDAAAWTLVSRVLLNLDSTLVKD